MCFELNKKLCHSSSYFDSKTSNTGVYDCNQKSIVKVHISASFFFKIYSNKDKNWIGMNESG